MSLSLKGLSMEKKYDKTYPLSVLQDLIDEIQEAENTDAIKKATLDLIDAVERYVRQECSRSTLISRKEFLKKTDGI